MSYEPLPISEREREILRLVATGATNQQIALALSISSNTVKVHLRNIFAKIAVVSRTEATVWAIRHGLVTLETAQAAAERVTLTDAATLPSAATPDAVPDAAAPDAAVLLPIPPLTASHDAGNAPPTADRSGTASADNIPAEPAVATRPAPALTPDTAVGTTPARRIRPIVTALLLTAVIAAALSLPAFRPFSAAVPAAAPTAATTATTDNGRWLTLSSPREPVDAAALVAYEAEQQLYLLGGRSRDGRSRDLVQRYDVVNDQWTTIGVLPEPLQQAAAASMRGLIYVAGGTRADGTLSDQLWIFDPLTQAWQAGPTFPTARSRAALVAWDGVLYLIGGWDGRTYRSDVVIYDAQTAEWILTAGLAEPRADAAAVVAAGRLYISGGVNASGALSSTGWLASPADSRLAWQATAALPEAISAPGAVSLGGTLLIFDPLRKRALSYDRGSDSWNISDLDPTARPSASGTLLGDRIYFVGDSAADGQLSAYQALYTILIPIR